MDQIMRKALTMMIVCTLWAFPAVAEERHQWYSLSDNGCEVSRHSPAEMYEFAIRNLYIAKIIEEGDDRVDVTLRFNPALVAHPPPETRASFFRSKESCNAEWEAQKQAAEQRKQQLEKALEKYR
jgi:GrpB-like predicted nucleotidyltransferase (UPF0157 family)